MWDYDHIDETRERLLSRRVIDLCGEVDENMAMYVRDSLMMLVANDNPDITVVITSNGGEVSVALAIYDMLVNYPGKVTGEIKSFCRSAATLIFQACGRRVISPNSKIKIHNILVSGLSLSVMRNPKKIAIVIAGLEADQRTINKIYSLRTGQSLKKVEKESNRDIEMTAQEALEFGLVDEII